MARRILVGAVVLVVASVGILGAYFFYYNTGTVSIMATDDALDLFGSLNITFSEVALHKSGGGNDSGWTTLKLSNRTIDLTHLANNVSSQVGFDRVAPGNYTQLRITVSSAVGTLKTGGNVTLNVPSGQLKTETPFELKAQGSATIVLRISVVQAGVDFSLQPALGSIQTSP